jgi:hypothetical protein
LEAARDLLRRRLAGAREVTEANRPLYPGLAVRIIASCHTSLGGGLGASKVSCAGRAGVECRRGGSRDAPERAPALFPEHVEQRRTIDVDANREVYRELARAGLMVAGNSFAGGSHPNAWLTPT